MVCNIDNAWDKQLGFCEAIFKKNYVQAVHINSKYGHIGILMDTSKFNGENSPKMMRSRWGHVDIVLLMLVDVNIRQSS